MAEIAAKASFEHIRYAQAWEDADVLCAAIGPRPGGALLSVCAAGDNALALLTLDPARVVAADLSEAQLACLRLRIAAMRALAHDEFLQLLGARSSDRRSVLLDRSLVGVSAEDRAFWSALRDEVVAYGAANVGKFERYFRIFRRFVLPLVHSRRTIADVFATKSPDERATFFRSRWNTWRWRAMLTLFFSNHVMGLLGRDPAFFDHVEGSLADHVAERVRHAGVDLDPSRNPYMRQILAGEPGGRLPCAWRAENYEIIRARLDRLELRRGDIVAAAQGERFDGFNLSDIFEYMGEPEFEKVYGALLDIARPGARLAYWNMMAPRARPAGFASRAQPLAIAEKLAFDDMAFFYRAFHVDEATC